MRSTGADRPRHRRHRDRSAGRGHPVGTWAYPIRPAELTLADLAGYAVRRPAPTRVDYRSYQVYGMATPSSGGQAVGRRSTSWSAPTWPGCPGNRRCTATSRRARSPSPTATGTSATRPAPVAQ
ncbi:hypothetical protein ACFQX7_30030 [Luedemannella flava]